MKEVHHHYFPLTVVLIEGVGQAVKKLNDEMKTFIHSCSPDENFLAKIQRSVVVKTRWKCAVRAVYKDAAQLILDHVNAVYILRAEQVYNKTEEIRVKNTGTVLVVYADDSMVRSDIDARQEFLKLKLNEQGECVETFCIKPSRFDMRGRHPFCSPVGDVSNEGKMGYTKKNIAVKPLSEKDYNFIISQTSQVKNTAVAQALQKAMIADLQRKNYKKEKNNT